MESKAQKAVLYLYEEKVKNLIEVAKRGGIEYNTFYDSILNERAVVGPNNVTENYLKYHRLWYFNLENI
ncbi:MAG: hypothetical protein HY752_05705 [Nitrospirae bacterium]|nr:hypothetical protein [Nitrospirota bacterium]